MISGGVDLKAIWGGNQGKEITSMNIAAIKKNVAVRMNSMSISTHMRSITRNITAKKKVIGAILLVVAVFVGGSYLFGISTEKMFRKNMAEITWHGIKASVTDYRRGIFSATARTEWVLARPGKEPLILSFNHHILHGPFLTPPSTANIRSELIPSKELSALLVDTFGSDPFGGKVPLTIELALGWGGRNHIHVVFPKFETPARETKARFSWGGLDGRITVDSNLSKIKARVVLGGLSMTGSDENQIQMDHLAFQTDMKKAGDHAFFFVGTSNFTLNKLSRQGADRKHDASLDVVFEKARGETDTTFKDGALNLKIRLDADSIIMGDRPKTAIDKPGATFLYENIDAGALETFLRAMLSQNGEEDPLLVLQGQAGALLQRKPAFSIKDVSASGPEGASSGNFRFAYTGDGNLDQFSLADITVDLQFNLPVAPINRLLEEQGSRGYAEEAKKQIETIDAMINKGALIEKDGILSADASLKSGNLSLNGHMESLEILQELLELF